MNPVMTPGEAKSRELKDDERSVSTIAQANGLFNFEDEEILQTEEEALDAELQLRPLTEEEVALKATEEYWNFKADKFMKAADKFNRNGLLSRAEIQSFAVGNTSGDDDDDRWFVEWFIIDNYGENFTRYDVDNSGEVDIHELRTAIAEWALYAKETTAAAAHRQAAARERKLQLKEGRRLMLENADARAAEIMELCLLNGASSLTITVFGMRTHLEPVPRLKPFVDWMLKDRMRVWKKYDADKSGTIELGELESALDEYFDEIASEFDELKGDGGRVQSEGARREGLLRPPPPVLKASDSSSSTSSEGGDHQVVLEWPHHWKQRRLVLQSVRVTTTTSEGAAAAQAQGGPGSEWTTIYDGAYPRRVLALTEPSALYLFRLKALPSAEDNADNADNTDFAEAVSKEVYWVAQPAAPFLCGLGRSLLVSWSFPVLPPSLATSLRPPAPHWRIHTRRTDTRAGANGGVEEQGAAAASSSSESAADGVTVVGQGRSWGVVPNLFEDATYEVSVSLELPAGMSKHSAPMIWRTHLTPIGVRNGSSDAISLAMPPVVDPQGALSVAGVTPKYRLEAKACCSEDWRCVYEGTAAMVAMRGLPRDVLGDVRVAASLDLTGCSRHGDGPMTRPSRPNETSTLVSSLEEKEEVSSPVLQLNSERAANGVPSLVEPEEESPNKTMTQEGNDLNDIGAALPLMSVQASFPPSPAFGAASSDKTLSRDSEVPLPGTSKARSRAFRTMLREEEALARALWPLSSIWDLSPVAQVLLPPSAPAFVGNAAAYMAHVKAVVPRLEVMWAPRVVGDALRQEFVFCCQLWEAGRWRCVYEGPEPYCDLMPWDNRATPPSCGTFVVVRSGRMDSSLAAASPSPAETDNWSYGEGSAVLLAPHPPVCTFEPSTGTLLVEWPDPSAALDYESHLPATVSPCILGVMLEVARGPLLEKPHRTQESVGPLQHFQEVARSLARGSARVPLSPGYRYACRLKVLTAKGSATSAPVCLEARPTPPLPPLGLRARVATFASGTSRGAGKHVELEWTEPLSTGLPIDRYMLQARTRASSSSSKGYRQSQGRREVEPGEEAEGAMAGEVTESNDEVNLSCEWATIYVGANTSAGDASTLRRKRVQKEYRVAAGNGLGWSEWSPVLPVNSELAVLSPSRSDGAVLSSVDALNEVEAPSGEREPIFSETVLVQTEDGTGTRRLQVTATPMQSGQLALRTSMESFPSHQQHQQQQEPLYLDSEDLMVENDCDQSKPAWTPNPLVQTHPSPLSLSMDGQDIEPATRSEVVRSAADPSSSSLVVADDAFKLAQFRRVLKQRLRINASTGVLSWTPLKSADEIDDAPSVLIRIEYVDAAPLQLVLCLRPGRRREECEDESGSTKEEADVLPSRKLLVKIISKMSGGVVLETTDFVNDRTSIHSFDAEELSAAGLELTSSSEGLSEESAMLFVQRLAFKADGAIVLLHRRTSNEAHSLETSTSNERRAPAHDSAATSSTFATWPFSALESTPAALVARDTALESRVMSEASKWVPASDEVLQHAVNAFFAAPRLAPPFRSTFMSMLAEITATEARALAASRGLVRPPSRFLNTVQGPIYSRPPSQSPKGARHFDWAIYSARKDVKSATGGTRPKSVSKQALRSPKSTFVLGSAAGSLERRGTGSSDVNDMQLLLLGNQSASKAYASSSSSRTPALTGPASSGKMRLRPPKLPPLNYQPHKWGPTTPPRHRTHRMPSPSFAASGASSASDKHPEVQEELERDELGLLWRT